MKLYHGSNAEIFDIDLEKFNKSVHISYRKGIKISKESRCEI